jgi:hypothetical protein
LLEGELAEAKTIATRLLASRIEYWSLLMQFTWLLSGVGEHEGLRRLIEEADELSRDCAWAQVGKLIADGRPADAADELEAFGDLTDASFARLQAAEQLAEAGRRAEADDQLSRALAFFRSVGATRYMREAERLLAQPA